MFNLGSELFLSVSIVTAECFCVAVLHTDYSRINSNAVVLEHRVWLEWGRNINVIEGLLFFMFINHQGETLARWLSSASLRCFEGNYKRGKPWRHIPPTSPILCRDCTPTLSPPFLSHSIFSFCLCH